LKNSTTKVNNCKTHISFSCGEYTQPSCGYFQQAEDVPTTACKYGLFERPCRLVNANLESLYEEIKDIEFVIEKLRKSLS
jgi:hypothetical protein